MPASPYDATKLAEGSKKGPLNGLAFNTVQAAGRVIADAESRKSTLNAGWPLTLQVAMKTEQARLSHLAYDEVLGYGTPMVRSGGSISGVVTDGSSPLVNVIVRLYYRVTGQLVYTARTNNAGQFQCWGASLDKSGQYYAIAFDPDGGPLLNAVIFDYLTPV